MRRVLILVIAVLLAWQGYQSYSRAKLRDSAPEQPATSGGTQGLLQESQAQAAPADGSYTCDGREYCSQMTSCEEAKYFIQHCPNTKMDGNNDGVPCERQWCKSIL
jgi:hypothetical protein